MTATTTEASNMNGTADYEAFDEEMDVPLTDSERMSLAKELADAISRREALEIVKKEKADEMKAKIELQESIVRDLRTKATTGMKRTTVPCYERPLFANNTMQIVRRDTGEVLRERALDPEERQANLQLDLANTEPAPPDDEDGGEHDIDAREIDLTSDDEEG